MHGEKKVTKQNTETTTTKRNVLNLNKQTSIDFCQPQGNLNKTKQTKTKR
jgi:hypothetical protein